MAGPTTAPAATPSPALPRAVEFAEEPLACIRHDWRSETDRLLVVEDLRGRQVGRGEDRRVDGQIIVAATIAVMCRYVFLVPDGGTQSSALRCDGMRASDSQVLHSYNFASVPDRVCAGQPGPGHALPGHSLPGHAGVRRSVEPGQGVQPARCRA